MAEECRRLGLKFAMHNSPGWAMSGGPWIKPENAMRHLVWSRTDVEGGSQKNLTLPVPQPSNEEWRDYRDIAVLAFPTPYDDVVESLKPLKKQRRFAMERFFIGKLQRRSKIISVRRPATLDRNNFSKVCNNSKRRGETFNILSKP
jgi:hypothetical protein